MAKQTHIHTNLRIAEDVRTAWETQMQSLQSVIDLYNATGLPALVKGDLNGLFNNTDIFLFDKLTGNETAHLVIGEGENKTQLPLSKEHAINILQKPVGYDALIAAIAALSDKAYKGITENAGTPTYAGYNVKAIDRFFCIEDNGQLGWSPKVIEEIENAGCYYIKSVTGNKIYAFVEGVVAAYYKNGIESIHLGEGGKPSIKNLLEMVIDRMDDKNHSFIAQSSFAGRDRGFLNREENQATHKVMTVSEFNRNNNK